MIKYSDDEGIELRYLWNMIRYADHNRDFNRNYIDDIYEFYEKHEYITANQLGILKKMYFENDVEDFLLGDE